MADEIEVKEIWIVRNRLGGLLLASETQPLRDDAVKVSMEETAADQLLSAATARAWLIRDERGVLLHRALKLINDPRASEVAAENTVLDEALKPGVVWVVKDAVGVIFDVCEHYPFHPDAQPTTKDDPELIALWSAPKPTTRDLLAEIDALKARLDAMGAVK